MRQGRLEHAIRTACQIIGRHEMIVVGSQSSMESRSRLEATTGLGSLFLV
jgi:hypothetical protein